jgi:putative CocE/NonD family hydrolase
VEGLLTMRHRTDFPHAVREIENLWIELADGCRLAARVWLPEDAEARPVPAILEYLPYRKRDGTAWRDALTHPWFAGHGYAAVRVDLRGSGESDGLLLDEYLKQEQDDALEVIDWLGRQPWCSGALGMIGISWGGFNGLQVAMRRPPALKAVVSICSTVDRYADDIHFKGGCQLAENLGWSSTMLAFQSRPPDPLLVGERWREMWLERLRELPHLVAAWLDHPTRDAYWQHGSVCEDWAAIQCPVLAVGGWNDAYKNAPAQLLANLRAPVKAIVGPWLHKYPHFAVPGPRIGFLQECLRWWDRWLKGIANGVEDDPAYRAYLQDGIPPRAWIEDWPGRWVAEPAWPSPNVRTETLHFNADGLGREPGTKTSLTVRSPQTTGLAGGEYCAIWLGPELPINQRRDDAGSLCFDGPPLPERLEILGAPAVELELAADRAVAFVVVRLCDVAPDGASARVSYGVLNLCQRDSREHPEPLEPGRRYRVRVLLDHIGWAVPAGHRLRVAVSTCYWPMLWPAPEPVTLTVTAGASRLELPVRTAGEDVEVAFAPPEAAPPQPLETLREPSHRRLIEEDVGAGEVTLAIVDDFGETRDLAHGLATAMVARETWRIREGEPLSARGETHWTVTLARDGWSIRTETFASMHADAEAWHVTARVEAYEGEALVLERELRTSHLRRLQ